MYKSHAQPFKVGRKSSTRTIGMTENLKFRRAQGDAVVSIASSSKNIRENKGLLCINVQIRRQISTSVAQIKSPISKSKFRAEDVYLTSRVSLRPPGVRGFFFVPKRF